MYVADPLPVIASPHQAKVRLHDTIKCLNARQKSRLIRFRGDGCGVGVLGSLWRSRQAGKPSETQCPPRRLRVCRWACFSPTPPANS